MDEWTKGLQPVGSRSRYNDCPHGELPNFLDTCMTNERMENIETRLAFQEDLIEELNKTVYRQQQRLERLEATCEALARRLYMLAESAGDGLPADEKPPHY